MDRNQLTECGGRRLRAGSRSRRWSGRGTLLFLFGFLLIAALPLEAQHRITGRVTAAGTGEPLSGVQVQVRGTTVGALTNASGLYQITAPSTSGTLAFTRIGYSTQSVDFSGQTTLNVELTLQATELEGIVVIGYGERARATLTESVGVVSSEQIRQVAVASPDQAIQGRVTGAQIISQSGQPGAPVAIRIRGVGTIGNTQPLFVVDGIPVGRGDTPRTNPLATINPADIESISVLKDASAAAVYGVQAANGVVLITTRRGVLGKPTIRYDAYQGFQRMPRLLGMNNTEQWYDLMRESIDNRNAFEGRGPDHGEYLELPVRIRPVHKDGTPNPDYDPSLLQRFTDWQRIPLNQNAPMMNHNLSVSGATEDINYYVSASYFQQDAIQQKWDLNRLSFRANSDFQVTPRIRFGETFSLSNSFTLRGQHQQGDGRILHNSLRMAPIYQYLDPTCATPAGCPNNRYGFASNVGLLESTRGNQPAINHILDVEERFTRMMGGLHAEVDIVDGLTFRSAANLDYHIRKLYQWSPGYANHEVGLDRNSPSAFDERDELYGIVTTNTLNYNGSFGSHNTALLAGMETQQSNWNRVGVQRSSFLSFDEGFRRIVGGGNSHQGWAGENAFLGYFGRISYDFDQKYLFTATVRRDGASTFAPGHQWGTFPSFSAGWRLTEEPFFNVPWLNELKIRGGWGQLGNSSIEGGAYPHLLAVALNSTYTLNGTEWSEDVPIPSSRFPNPGLTWESTTTTDFGFEASLFNHAFDFAATYYNRNTSDFLLNVDLPLSSGFQRSPFNSGRVNNRGIEVEAGYRPPRIGGVDLHISGNLTTVRNRLLSLAEEIETYTPSLDRGTLDNFGYAYRTEPGFPVGFFYGYQTCGVYQTAAEAAQAPIDGTLAAGRRPQAGDMCFVDVTGDGQITEADRTYLGKNIPGLLYGLNLNANFRQFDLTAFFNGVGDVQLYNRVRRDLEGMWGGGDNFLATTQNRWRPDNPSNTMPRAISGDPVGNARFSDRWIENGRFFRLRTLQLGYTMPPRFLGTQNTRIYLSAQNLFTITPYSGYDPEFTTTIDHWRSRNDLALFQGTDTGDMPQPRIFQIGVSTAF